jgi:hypothetical protein
MDEQYPPGQRPQSNHPNAVNPIVAEQTERTTSIPTPREPLPPQYQKEKGKKGRYLIIAVVILLIAAATYWFLLKPKPAKAPVVPRPKKLKLIPIIMILLILTSVLTILKDGKLATSPDQAS